MVGDALQKSWCYKLRLPSLIYGPEFFWYYNWSPVQTRDITLEEIAVSGGRLYDIISCWAPSPLQTLPPPPRHCPKISRDFGNSCTRSPSSCSLIYLSSRTCPSIISDVSYSKKNIVEIFLRISFHRTIMTTSTIIYTPLGEQITSAM